MKALGWITIALLIAASLVLLVHLSTTSEEFSRYNVGWTGTSAFFGTLDTHTGITVTSPEQLAGYRGATLLIIAPDHEYTQEEVALYRNFIARGNTLLLADDFGTGNSFLQAMGSSIAIGQGNLSSADRAYDNAYMIVVTPVGDGGGFVPAGASLVLDQAAPLSGGEPLLNSSVYSWVDTVPDRQLSAGEVLGRYPVMAREKIGAGTLYVLSDPSIFINGMQDPGPSYANRRFLEGVARAPAPLLVDRYGTRVQRVGGMGELIQEVRSSTGYTFAIAALLMAGIAIAWRRRLL
jgi:hypothetical protein